MPQKMSEQPATGEVLHGWEIREYDQFIRTTPWYVVMGLVGVGLVLYGLFTQNILFSLIIVLFAIILFVQSHQEPPVLPFSITELGIIIADRFYSYNELDAFYILYNPPQVKSLYFETKSFLRPRIRIPLYNENPVEIRHSLQDFLDEDVTKDDEPLSDKISRGFGIH